MEHQYLDGVLTLKTGDLTRERVDAIVNAANSSLLGGGGVDGAIHRAGGPAILQACRKFRETQFPAGLPVGEAVITTAGELPARFVIHTVGPVWHGGNSGEEEQLAAAYENSLQLAEREGLASVAFPAISTGIFGFPKDKAGRIALAVIRRYLDNGGRIRDIRLVFFNNSDMDSFLSANGL